MPKNTRLGDQLQAGTPEPVRFIDVKKNNQQNTS